MKIASNIYQFNDYRLFLKDRYAQLKVADAAFSFRNFSKEAGFGSPNYLKLVMDNKRNLSEEAIEKFAKGLRLDSHEAEFFHYMVLANQCTASNKKVAYEAKLSYLKELFTVKDLIPELYDYYHDWYHAAIREIVKKKSLENNAEKIAQSLVPSITTQQALASIELLKSLNYITESNGVLQAVAEQEDDVAISDHMAKKIQHEQMAELAAQSIYLQDNSSMGFESLTVSLSSEKLDELKAQIQELVLSASKQSQEGENQAVYQFNVQVFALTKVETASLADEPTVRIELP